MSRIVRGCWQALVAAEKAVSGGKHETFVATVDAILGVGRPGDRLHHADPVEFASAVHR
jgi:hypothetical protein